MADSKTSDRMAAFVNSGIYRFESCNRCSWIRKRIRKEKKILVLNDREKSVNERHREARPLLSKAHESLRETTDLVSVFCNLRNDVCCLTESEESLPRVEHSFVELGRIWQAPLYEITLHLHQHCKPGDDGKVRFGADPQPDSLEKLRSFVEKELFPSWGISYAAAFYWLKVKSDGSLIIDLDLIVKRYYIFSASEQ